MNTKEDVNAHLHFMHNAGLDSVIVLWGFRERELLEQYGAKVFAQDTEECLRLLQ